MPPFPPVNPEQQQINAILERLFKLEKNMSTIATQLTNVQTALTATQADVSSLAAGVTSLEATVTQLQQSIANEGDNLSPATQAILASLVTQASAVKSAADAAVSELPPSPAPAA
jgi:chromosome segregation ATPase